MTAEMEMIAGIRLVIYVLTFGDTANFGGVCAQSVWVFLILPRRTGKLYAGHEGLSGRRT